MLTPKKSRVPQKIGVVFFAFLSPKNWDFTTPEIWGTQKSGDPKYPKNIIFEKSKEKHTYLLSDLKVEVVWDLVLKGLSIGGIAGGIT